MNRAWKVGAIAVAGGLVALAFANPATAAPVTTQQKIDTYWTADRMRSAIPMDKLAVRSAAVKPGAVAAGTPTIIGSTPSVSDVSPQAFPNKGSAWTGGGAVVKTTGRVFFTFQGKNASCSGSAVTSANKSTIITAGHCVKYQGAWHTNWAFAPAYNNGATPYGKWTSTKLTSTPQWVASEDINYDVGAAVVDSLNGQKLTDVVGGQAIAFNQARGQRMYSFGYPAAAPYDGSKLIYCSGTAINDFLLSKDIGLDCNMTGGSSGGPWFLNFSESAGTGALNSVNSFKYNFLPNYMFGPYFGAEAQAVYTNAQAS